MNEILREGAAAPLNSRGRPETQSLLRRMLALAWPLMLAQAAFLGMVATDTVVAGRYSATTLAGVGLGSSILIPGYCLLMGLCLAVAPGVARQLGAGAGRAGLREWVAGALLLGVGGWFVLLLLLQLCARPLAEWLAPEPAVAAEVIAYLRWGTLGFPFMGLFYVLRNVVEAHGVSRPIMWLGLSALLLNLPLDLVFVFGYGPIPAMGAAGCGVATAFIQLFLGLGLVVYMLGHGTLRAVFPRWGPASPAGLRELFSLGMPVGLAMLAESSLFALGGLLMARFGTAALAAHQICNTLAALAFMIQVGIGQATAVLTGRALGEESAAGIRASVRAGVLLGLIFGSLVLIVYLFGGSWLVGLFSPHPEVRAIGAVFILWAAAFHIFDAMQAIFAAALRGLHDTRSVLLLTVLSYSLLAVPLMVYWTLSADIGPVGIWWAFTAGLALAAFFLMLRYGWQQQRLSAHWSD